MHGGVSPSDYMLLEMYCVIDFWCYYLFIRACSLQTWDDYMVHVIDYDFDYLRIS